MKWIIKRLSGILFWGVVLLASLALVLLLGAAFGFGMGWGVHFGLR